MSSHMDNVRTVIDGTVKVLQTFKWLLDLYVLDFFVDNHWDMLPQSWRDTFQDIDPQTLGYLLQDHPTNHMFPLSFLALVKFVKSMSLPRKSTYQSSNKKVDIVNNQKLRNMFLKHVKLKKRHEISLMANVVNDVARASGCDAVIDFGSGLGHLVRMLSYNFGLKTVGIECQSQLTEEARKLDLELEYTAKKYVNIENITSLPRPIHCNETLSSADQLETLSLKETIHNHGLIGLHPCGNLGPLLLKYFVQCNRAQFICLVGCCYMKLSSDGYPMSEYVKGLDCELSYASREIACHAIESYCEKLCKGDYNDLKVHAFRAALERVLVDHDPNLRHSPIRSVKHTDNMTFESYSKVALGRLSVTTMDTSKSTSDLAQWKRVVVLYTLRLVLAPLVETVILLDRLYYMMEHGIHCEIHPVFDPNISPRNHVMIGRKMFT
ncbi:methyltransferase-like protein 25B [Colias croceus]|uniref:methyltransferase-like protein 25B n=1 Tax=Colias crocea TaxID=72248 RepID=UPI001E281537|nr:methyltransferase-like protein 25B [Colias croceus]